MQNSLVKELLSEKDVMMIYNVSRQYARKWGEETGARICFGRMVRYRRDVLESDIKRRTPSPQGAKQSQSDSGS